MSSYKASIRRGPSIFQQSSDPPCSKLQLSISVDKIKKLDILSASDPMCVVYLKSFRSNNHFVEIGRTEVKKNSPSAQFSKTFVVDFYFEEVQTIKFVVFDQDDPKGSLDRQDLVGEVEMHLSELVGIHRGEFRGALKHHKPGFRGNICVNAEELNSGNNDIVHFNLRATGLDKMDFFGKSDPFLKIYRASSNGWMLVHQTEVIKKTLDPTWRPFSMSMAEICNGDLERPLKIECFDWDSDSSSDFIGHVETSLAQMTQPGGMTLNLVNPKKTKKRNYNNSGLLHVVGCSIQHVPSFLDYIQAGFELSFVVAIDFTASNGEPSKPTSLHYYNPPHPNSYVEAIDSVGMIIQDYDKDKQFPAFGFGAQMPNGQVLHDFALNHNPHDPVCYGIQGVLDAYLRSLSTVRLYGPTNFAPIITKTARMAASTPNAYTVLLIVTDGAISDMGATIDAIVQASACPLSIIIIGVGNADFSSMEILDGDDQRLSSRGRTASRDIVQFVPMRKFSGPFSHQELTKEVLAELPQQFIEYVTTNKIPVPNIPREPMRQDSFNPDFTAPSAPQFQDASQPDFSSGYQPSMQGGSQSVHQDGLPQYHPSMQGAPLQYNPSMHGTSQYQGGPSYQPSMQGAPLQYSPSMHSGPPPSSQYQPSMQGAPLQYNPSMQGAPPQYNPSMHGTSQHQAGPPGSFQFQQGSGPNDNITTI